MSSLNNDSVMQASDSYHTPQCPDQKITKLR